MSLISQIDCVKLSFKTFFFVATKWPLHEGMDETLNCFMH